MNNTNNNINTLIHNLNIEAEKYRSENTDSQFVYRSNENEFYKEFSSYLSSKSASDFPFSDDTVTLINAEYSTSILLVCYSTYLQLELTPSPESFERVVAITCKVLWNDADRIS